MSDLMDSLVKARKNMKMPPMNGVGHAGRGGSREYKYALLSDVLGCIMPPLLDEGVLLYQSLQGGVLRTMAAKGDEVIELDARSVNLSGTSQEQGSAETYAKRYALCTVFCIAGIEDDDGAAASERPQDERTVQAKRRMWGAIQKWAELHGRAPEDVLNGVQKRPEWAETVEFFTAVADEFEGDLNG